MNDALLDLAPHLRERLAASLESGVLGMAPSPAGLRSVLGSRDSWDGLFQGLRELQQAGASGPTAAAWIRSIDKILNRTKKPDLVWSGPEVPNLHARDTRRVYEELLGSAQHTLWASTYAFFDGPKAFDVLAKRMEMIPSLRVSLLLNVARKWGDDEPTDSLVRRFADRLWKMEWPGRARPQVWYDPRALDPARPSGVLHAKAVVCDDEIVFITSANLTEAAWDRNIELGLLIRDRALAASVSSHFQGLIDGGILRPLPNS